MILSHFPSRNPEDWQFDKNRSFEVYDKDEGACGKPVGFWLSDEQELGWKTWCDTESFRKCEHEYKFDVDMTDVLHIKSQSELRRFDKKWAKPNPNNGGLLSLYRIDWKKVYGAYKGILITPYQWSCRYDINWYYGWDCASGCFWDISCLTEIDGE